MAKKSRTYLWQFVIGLGFLSGLWTAIGIDPEAVILNTLGKAAYIIYPDPAIRTLFILLPTVLLLISCTGHTGKGVCRVWPRSSPRTLRDSPSLSQRLLRSFCCL